MTKAEGSRRLLTTQDVADITGMSAQTFYRKRKDGSGPKFVRLGTGPQAPVRYRQCEVEKWLESCVVDPAVESA